MLSGLLLMVQAAVLDCVFFDTFSPFLDSCIPSEVDIVGRYITDIFVIALVILILDESCDLVFQMPWQVIVFQQDTVLQGLMPTFNLALGLGMVWRATDMVHALVFQPLGQIA